ncbi:MAG: TnpV protein [Clostridia bacterium]
MKDLEYTLVGDYYLPNLTLPTEKEVHIGYWGQKHREYIEKHHRIRFFNLLTSSKLSDYLADINNQAEDMFFQLVEDYEKSWGVTEQLKVENQMEWVSKMNNIHSCVREIILKELIYW